MQLEQIRGLVSEYGEPFLRKYEVAYYELVSSYRLGIDTIASILILSNVVFMTILLCTPAVVI